MNKILSLFVLPLICGAIIITALHTFIPVMHRVNMDMLTTSGANYIFGLLGFLFGFLPAFIVGLARVTLAGLRPVPVAEIEQTTQDINIYVGQTFTTSGANCGLRVKSLKVRAILDYNNDLLSDYL